MVGELYAATAGLGHMIAEAGNTFQTDTLFFGVLLFTGTGLVITGVSRPPSRSGSSAGVRSRQATQ